MLKREKSPKFSGGTNVQPEFFFGGTFIFFGGTCSSVHTLEASLYHLRLCGNERSQPDKCFPHSFRIIGVMQIWFQAPDKFTCKSFKECQSLGEKHKILFSDKDISRWRGARNLKKFSLVVLMGTTKSQSFSFLAFWNLKIFFPEVEIWKFWGREKLIS